MPQGNIGNRVIAIQDILLTQSDKDHILSMPTLITLLAEKGIACDRRSVYRCIEILKDSGHPVHFTKRNGQGYYMNSSLSLAEAYFLISCIQESSAISETVSKQLTRKILSLLSEHERKQLPVIIPSATKTTNSQVFLAIEVLMNAIACLHPVQFLYFDYTVNKQKQYRRQNKRYELIPQAIVSNRGRFYCVFYSVKHQSFANYRIDKMEQVRMLPQQIDPQPFNLADYLKSNFDMYAGTPQTITAQFDLSLANIVFDQFGQNIIISSVHSDTFTASIQTTITPTLISWLVLFQKQIVVKKPQSLINQLLQVAQDIQNTYHIKK